MTNQSSAKDIADAVAAGLSGNDLLELTAAISREVRLSGSAEEARSFETIKAMLDEAGLRTRLIHHEGYVSLPLKARIVVGSEELPAITHSLSAATPPAGIQGRPVDNGWNAPGPEAAGTVLICDGIAMHGLVSRNERAGVAAQIFICGELTHEMCVSAVWGSPAPEDFAKLPRTPVVSITQEVGERLRSLITKGAKTITVHAEVDTGWRRLPLLIADLCPPGIDGLDQSSAPYVLFSGHLDSWHLGAMDNGSANAVMVGVARELAKHRPALRRSLRLAFWSGHSHGRYAGSAWYADEFHHDLSTRCIAHVNIDSVGGQGATVLTDAVAMPSTLDCGARAIASESGQAFLGSRVVRAGDQSFVQLGVPSLFMALSEQPPSDTLTSRAFGGLVAGSRTGGLGWWWHTVADTLDKLDVELLERDGRIYGRTLADLTCASVAPLRPDRQAEAFVAELRALAELCTPWFDLSGTIALAEEASRALTALETRRRGKPDESDDELRMTSDAMRPLIELAYAGSGVYAHDAAIPLPAIPQLALARDLGKLDEAQRASALVTLRRRRNYIDDRLRAVVRSAAASRKTA